MRCEESSASSRKTRRVMAMRSGFEARARVACCARSQQVDGIEWVRFLYAYPTTVDDAVLDAMAERPRSFVVMSTSRSSMRAIGCLKAMKRPGTAASNQSSHRADSGSPSPTLPIRSSFIVGFPGETEEDFQALLDFCAERSSSIIVGVFTYSNEARHRGLRADRDGDSPPRRRAARREAAHGAAVGDISLEPQPLLGSAHRVRVLVRGPFGGERPSAPRPHRAPGARASMGSFSSTTAPRSAGELV